jgi:hypothetical protein
MPASKCTARYPRLPKRCKISRRSAKKKVSTAASGRQRLLRSEVTGLVLEIPLLQTLDQSVVAVEDVSSGIETFRGMDNHVEVVELRSHRIEEVRWYCPRLHGLSARRQILTLLLLNVAR